MRWKPAKSAAWNVRHGLPVLAHEYFEAGRKLHRKSSVKDMHRFRLRTKHFRYTLEIFTALYGPGLARRIELLRPIQSSLGGFNDCEDLLSRHGNRLPREARTYIRNRSGGKRKEFLRYWRDEFDATGEEKKWERYLTRF